MALPELAGEQITIIRGTAAIDAYNTPFIDWSIPTELTSNGWSIQPVDTQDQSTTTGELIPARWRGYGPSDADITEADRIRHRGQVYDIEGHIQHWSSPTGQLDHIEIALTRLSGQNPEGG